MNKNIDLSKMLKGHEGETFYSRCFGNVILIDHVDLKFKASKEHDEIILEYYHKGNYSKNGEQDLFPSKDQQDWNKWNEENNPKVPKTWSELVKENKYQPYFAEIHIRFSLKDKCAYGKNPIEKSAAALLKIHQLINVGYGGNVTNEEWKNIDKYKYIISATFHVESKIHFCSKNHIAFHTKEQAKEFLKYPENIQLLKDYFMI